MSLYYFNFFKFRTFSVNVKAIINVTKNFSKKMIEAGKKGSIVNVSSVVNF